MFYENKAFISNLAKWLDTSDQNAARAIESYKPQIPSMFKQHTGMLYRGMIIPSLPNKDFKIDEYTSWSKNRNISLGFLKDPKLRISKKTGISVLITKQILPSKIVLNIHSLAMFLGERQMINLGFDDLVVDSALHEDEVLISKDITIKPSDMKVIK